jgi:DNA-binding GntR family transcriptional regulator
VSGIADGAIDWRIARGEHEAIVAAISGHDPESARAAMRKHITRSRNVLRARFAEITPPVRDELARSIGSIGMKEAAP